MIQPQRNSFAMIWYYRMTNVISCVEGVASMKIYEVYDSNQTISTYVEESNEHRALRVTSGSCSDKRKACTHKSACQLEITFPSSMSPTFTSSQYSFMSSASSNSSWPFLKIGHDDWSLSVSMCTMSSRFAMQPSRICASTCTGIFRNVDIFRFSTALETFQTNFGTSMAPNCHS